MNQQQQIKNTTAAAMNALKQIEVGAYCRLLDISDGAIMVGLKRDPANPDNCELAMHTHGISIGEMLGVVELMMKRVNKAFESEGMSHPFPDSCSHLIHDLSHDSNPEAD